MIARPLGRTGLKVSAVGFGAWAIGGNAHGNSYGPTDDATSLAAVRRALDLGCTLFDTADVYGHGHSEEILGQALEGRDDVAVATKVGGAYLYNDPKWGWVNFSGEYVRFAAEQSRKRLRRKTIDLLQLHNPPVELIARPRLYDVLDDLRAEHVIRAYGVSIHQSIEGLTAIEVGRPDALQLPLNLFHEDWGDVLTAARKANVGIIAREPLANGFLAGKHDEEATFPPGDIRHNWPRAMIRSRVAATRRLAGFCGPEARTVAQLALKWVLAQPAVSSTIPGAKTPAHVEDNLAAGDGAALPTATLEALRQWREAGFGLA